LWASALAVVFFLLGRIFQQPLLVAPQKPTDFSVVAQWQVILDQPVVPKRGVLQPARAISHQYGQWETLRAA
jgi:hypothetical protein